MDVRCPTLTLKLTAEKFKVLANKNSESFESEDDDAVATDPLSDNDCTDSDHECASHCDRTECDNSTIIKSKPAMFKKE